MRGGVFDIPELAQIGSKYGKSAGQIALRWALQAGQFDNIEREGERILGGD